MKINDSEIRSPTPELFHGHPPAHDEFDSCSNHEPTAILMKQTAAASFDWHSTDANRISTRGYLSTDIRRSPEAAQELMAQIKTIESGPQGTTMKRIGNMYRLELSIEKVLITRAAAERAETTSVPFAVFKEEALAWQKAITD